MASIIVAHARENNLKNVSVRIPKGKFVCVVGKSGSGKSTFVHDVLYRASQGIAVNAEIRNLPRTFMLEQRVKPDGHRSLGETNFSRLEGVLKEVRNGDLLIVDEPCAGMAKEDRALVIKRLKAATKRGVTVIAVEHAKDVIASVDVIIEFGPESGAGGGFVVFEGPVSAFRKSGTPTASYVFSRGIINPDEHPKAGTRTSKAKTLAIRGITRHNVKNFDFAFPLGRLVCVRGRMGTGKSTLLGVVYGALFKGRNAWKIRGGFSSIEGKANVRRSYFVDQSLLGGASNSSPATYLGIWSAIKRAGRFVEKEKKSMEAMTVDEAAKHFADVPLIARRLGFLQEVGLGYLELGQKSNTLSGGEAQRVRMAKILSKKLGDRCVYIFDIPSRGLHLSDLPVLIRVFRKIIAKNNTVLIAENREEIIEACDAVFEMK
jgi:excinuclease ABC subunit A